MKNMKRKKKKVNVVHPAETRENMERPRICIPITESTRDEIVARAGEFASLRADMVEWRIDFFTGGEEEIAGIAAQVKQALAGKELIATLRTMAEGGEENGSRFDYRSVLTGLAEGAAAYVDVEVRRGQDVVAAVRAAAAKAGTRVIGSCHDFDRTPPEEEIVAVLTEARELGADIGKFACMPGGEEDTGREDVERLLAATEEMKKRYPDFPIITMSMGECGKDSRRYGGLYGSAVSFACVGKPSAPGQTTLDELNGVFDQIYCGRRHISLIGFMGVGKSTISRKLHTMTGRPEVDTDARIVEREGCSIARIFEEKGEAYFRRLETELLDGLGALEPSIISCGGGMAMRDLNVKKLRAMGEIVLLTATPETIYGRVKDSRDRPLLNGNMNVPYIKELMEKRRPFYERAATAVVATDGKSVSEIAAEIVRKCKINS